MSILERPMRSLFYVPGNKPDWIRKAPSRGADSIVIDLEDSVPTAQADTVRGTIARAVRACKEAGQPLVLVRPRELHRGGLEDIAAAANGPVDAFMIPKSTLDVVRMADRLLTELQSSAGILPILETPEGIVDSLAIVRAAPRIIGIFGGGGAKDGDPHHFIGFEWTPEGLESLYLRSQIVLHGRAARLPHIVGGAWVNLDDLDGLRAHAKTYRALGYTGYCVIHPAQIPVVQAVFSPSAEEVAWAGKIVQAMETAEHEGRGSTRLDGEMIDYATMRRARDILQRAGSSEG